MKKSSSYFFRAFLTILLSVAVFFVLKNLLPERLFAEVSVKSDNVIVDSLMLEALAENNNNDTIPLLEEKIKGNELPEEELKPNELAHFFERLHSLEETQKGTVRIAYFGDSMTESDLIVQDIRKNYQGKYGGRGVGFVPISLPTPPSSITIRHEFSNNWNTYSFLKKPPLAVGVSGYVSLSPYDATSWVKYKAGSSPLVHPTLLYGKSTNDSSFVQITTDKDSLKSIPLQPGKLLNSLALTAYTNSLSIHFSGTDSIPFYGVDFADKNGVYVDNFSSRGNSGLPLSTFSTGLMNAFQQKLHYDLIVLQYGTNVLSSKSIDYSWYAKRMATTVKHVRNCFPSADILVISLADKATKYGTEMKTDSAIVYLIKAQQTYAANTEAGFINLFELMGGEGSMVEWVEQSPALAAKDYTHFSIKGSKKIADLLFNKLEEKYEQFRKQNNLLKEEEPISIEEGETVL